MKTFGRILQAAALQALLLTAFASQASDGLSGREAWIRESADAANFDVHAAHGVFAGSMTMLHLAPDGRYTRQFVRGCGMSGPAGVSIGHYRRAGEFLILGPVEVQIEWEYDAMARDFRSTERLILGDEPELTQETRLLLVPQSTGLMLLDADQVADAANMINYNGQLPAWLMYSRREDSPQAYIDHDEREPLSAFDRASLPEALRTLLREAPVDGFATHVINGHALEWEAHEAELRIGLDRGANDGLYVGMSMHGGDFRGTVDALEADTAVLRIGIERFHPNDIPTFPSPGQHFSSVSERGDDDGDTGSLRDALPLHGNIIWLSDTEDLTWDDDGFAFLDVLVNIGADDGLRMGDLLVSVEDRIYAQARVEAIEPNQAHVLIRLKRYGFSDGAVPALGSGLATLAWQMARWDEEREARSAGEEIVND